MVNCRRYTDLRDLDNGVFSRLDVLPYLWELLNSLYVLFEFRVLFHNTLFHISDGDDVFHNEKIHP